MYYIGSIACDQNYLEHHGIKGQKWGIRRYQNSDGTLTEAGKKRYQTDSIKSELKDRYKSRSLGGDVDPYDDYSAPKSFNDNQKKQFREADIGGRFYDRQFEKAGGVDKWDDLRNTINNHDVEAKRLNSKLFKGKKTKEKIAEHERLKKEATEIADRYFDESMAEVYAYADSFSDKDVSNMLKNKLAYLVFDW